MRMLVIGAGMMGSAAAYDMARQPRVESVTLADADSRRAKAAAAHINRLVAGRKVRPVELDAEDESAAVRLMTGHDAALSAVPYFYNLGLARAAVDARCHFADLGGNNTVVRKTLDLGRKAQRRGVALAPDCGLSPGMASILAGELMRRIGGRADALKIYVGGLPEKPKPPFYYQLVFSVEGLINEYVEPARILRRGRIREIEPLTEPEEFQVEGYPPLVAFHTSGGASTLPETFQGKVGECWEKTLRIPEHFTLVRGLYDLGMFSGDKRKFGKHRLSPRRVMSEMFVDKFSGNQPDVVIMRVEATHRGRVASFTIFDRYDPKTKMTAMMRTTAWPASVVTLMMAANVIQKRGGILSELDVPADVFLEEMAARGIKIDYLANFDTHAAAAR